MLLGLAAAMVAASGCPREVPLGGDASQRPQRLPTATIRVGDTPLVVEVADTKEEQAKGMMLRTHLAPDEAMLFVFPRDSNLAFWMKDTPVDLDLAYIRSDGTITQTERMKAFNLESVYSREPVRFALEVPAGWLERHGVGVGTTVAVPPEVMGAGDGGAARGEEP
jgi:uncharacterized membrane protein (UPF0127 family)